MVDGEHKHSGGDSSGKYEIKDINLPKTFGYGLATVLLIVVFLVALNEYFIAVREDIVEEQVLRPESKALRELRSREDSLLSSYQLVDSANQTYRIPIERAMEVVAAESWKAEAGSQ